MNLSFQKISIKLTLAMLVLFSMALFVAPNTNEVQAQSGSFVACLNPSTGALVLPASGGGCPTGNTIESVPRRSTGFCVLRENNSSAYTAESPTIDSQGPLINATGDKCLGTRGDESTAYGKFVPFAAIRAVGTTNTNTNNSNTPSNSNNNNGGGTTSTPTSTSTCDGEPGFRKVGPLCVPVNPFDKDSIAGGDHTAGSIAARIIRILLYFAAIVAVIMIIIGGYRVMTAGGNAVQASEGRKTLTNAIIGLIIVILAYVIVQAVMSFITS